MGARVIHFGWDDCCRISVFPAAGFEVKVASSLDELSVDLQMADHVSAVVVSEDLEPTAELAADIVRRSGLAPVILSRHSHREIDEGKFDKVFECTTSPNIWLIETATLIANGHRLQGEEMHVLAKAAAMQAEAQRRQRNRAHGFRRRR